jgi:hypothetical protein
MKRFMLISLMSCMFVGQVFCADNNDTVVSADESAVVAGNSDNSGFVSKPVQWSLRGAQVGTVACLFGGIIAAIGNSNNAYANLTLKTCLSDMLTSDTFWKTTAMGTCAGFGTGLIAYLLCDWYKSCSDTSVDKTNS